MRGGDGMKCELCGGSHAYHAGIFACGLPESYKEHKAEKGDPGGDPQNFWAIITCPECGLRTYTQAWFYGDPSAKSGLPSEVKA